jgi:hypothetical protein
VVPLEQTVKDVLRNIMPKTNLQSGNPTLNHMATHLPSNETSLEDDRIDVTRHTDTTPNVTPFCQGDGIRDGTESFVPAILNLKFRTLPIKGLIDIGFVQSNVVSKRLAVLLHQDGGLVTPTNVLLRSGVGGIEYGVQVIVSVTVTFPPADRKEPKHICIRALICKDCNSRFNYMHTVTQLNLLPVLMEHVSTIILCESGASADQITLDQNLTASFTLTDENYDFSTRDLELNHQLR